MRFSIRPGYLPDCRAQMFVFGEVQDPNPNAVNLVEDIVRSQVLEIVGSWFLFQVWIGMLY